MTLPAPLPQHVQRQWLFFPERTVAEWFFREGFAERPLINSMIERFLTPTGTFIDIGAHVGTYTILAAKRCANVIAFECNPKVFCYLAANIALHRVENFVTIDQRALSNGSVQQARYMIRSPDGGGNGIEPVHLESDHKLPAQTVRCTSLDQYMTENAASTQNVQLVKIDVEGHEKAVLEGSLEFLKQANYPPILFESWGAQHGGRSGELRRELFEYIERTLDYSIAPCQSHPEMFLATRRSQ